MTENEEKLMHAGAQLAMRIAQLEAILERLASMPMTHENLHSTWCPPEYEDVQGWWDEFVDEARKITGKSYRADLASRYPRVRAAFGEGK